MKAVRWKGGVYDGKDFNFHEKVPFEFRVEKGRSDGYSDSDNDGTDALR